MPLTSAVPEISLGAQKFNMGHLTLTTPILRVFWHPYAGSWHSHCTSQNLTTLASAVPEIWLVPTEI